MMTNETPSIGEIVENRQTAAQNLAAARKALPAAEAAAQTLATARKAVMTAEVAAVAADNALLAVARKRKFDPKDPKAVKTAIKREAARKWIEKAFRWTTMRAADSWTCFPVKGPFHESYCRMETCFTKQYFGQYGEFKGFVECAYPDDRRDGRLCNVCFDKLLVHTSEAESLGPDAVFAEVDKIARRLREESEIVKTVEDVLYAASIDLKPYNQEPPLKVIERARDPDEWVHETPPIYCHVCDDDVTRAVLCDLPRPWLAVCASTDSAHSSGLVGEYRARFVPVAYMQGCITCVATTPATHVLKGWPSIRFCDRCYERRFDFRELMSKQSLERIRIPGWRRLPSDGVAHCIMCIGSDTVATHALLGWPAFLVCDAHLEDRRRAARALFSGKGSTIFDLTTCAPSRPVAPPPEDDEMIDVVGI